MNLLPPLLRLTRPQYLLFAALTYLLGAGVAHYLGILDVASVFWLGLIGTLLSQMSMILLGEVFRPLVEPLAGVAESAPRKVLRDAALYVASAGLAIAAGIGFILYRDGHLETPATLFQAISLLIVVLYSVPPMRWMDRGLGEVLLAIQVGYIFPSLGFLLQAGTYHRLLAAAVLPLTFLLLPTLIALDLPIYSEDLHYERRSLLVRIGWRAAISLHHALLVTAYLLLAAALLFGASFRLLWPGFLTIPFAAVQIIFLRNLAGGARPLWNLLTANAIAIFCLTTYLLTLSFWLK